MAGSVGRKIYTGLREVDFLSIDPTEADHDAVHDLSLLHRGRSKQEKVIGEKEM